MQNREQPTFCSKCQSEDFSIHSLSLTARTIQLGVSKIAAALCKDCGATYIYWTVSPGHAAMIELVHQLDQWAKPCGELIHKNRQRIFNQTTELAHAPT